jgi:iron(III) transport system substrate-binding protein
MTCGFWDRLFRASPDAPRPSPKGSRVRYYCGPLFRPRTEEVRNSGPYGRLTLLGVLLLGLLGCESKGRKVVVVYSSQDPEFAQPLLDAYSKESGVEVDPKFDVESTKTVGLAQLLIRESPKPRCDLFWNNEILNTLRLREKGLLATWKPSNAADIPGEFQARDGTWYGFAARARILIVNTKLMAESDRPKGLADLVDPRWKGKIAIAKPMAGTSATHFTCLFVTWGDDKARAFLADLKKNEVQVVSGNKQVAQAVGSGQALFGLTDTDDAMGEIDAGQPVAIVYPDRGEHELGTLFIPNVLAIPKGAPHPSEAEALGNALLGPDFEGKLASGPSAQIPLNRKTAVPPRVETPRTVHAMPADFEAAARIWDRVAAYLTSEFAGG